MGPRLKYVLVSGDFEGYFGVKSKTENDYYKRLRATGEPWYKNARDTRDSS